MKFSLDKEKAIELAKKLNISIKFSSKQPGVTLCNDEKLEQFDFEDFFPELGKGESFITKERSVFIGETLTRVSSTIVIELSPENLISISNSQKFTGAA